MCIGWWPMTSERKLRVRVKGTQESTPPVPYDRPLRSLLPLTNKVSLEMVCKEENKDYNIKTDLKNSRLHCEDMYEYVNKNMNSCYIDGGISIHLNFPTLWKELTSNVGSCLLFPS